MNEYTLLVLGKLSLSSSSDTGMDDIDTQGRMRGMHRDMSIYGVYPLLSSSPTGLLRSHGQPNNQAECCDVRWDSKPDNRSRGTLKRTPTPSCHHQQRVSTSVTSAATPTRLCSSSGRLKLCLLVFVLLHTVVTITTASHNSTGVVGVAVIFPLEESSSGEE